MSKIEIKSSVEEKFKPIKVTIEVTLENYAELENWNAEVSEGTKLRSNLTTEFSQTMYSVIEKIARTRV